MLSENYTSGYKLSKRMGDYQLRQGTNRMLRLCTLFVSNSGSGSIHQKEVL
jgi:hypothetical protein